MIHEFELWSAPRISSSSFSELSGTTLGIDASFYLDRLITHAPFKEPLISALGGLPFSLKAHIENELQVLKDVHIKPIFVFHGLDMGKKHAPFAAADKSAKRNAGAWKLYDDHLAERAVEAFGNSGSVHPEDFYPLLQQVLRSSGVEFIVAPYSAWGQLAYLVHVSQRVDAVAGPSELLLFDVDQVIVKLNFENSEFDFIKRQGCLEELGNIHPEMFVDACILAGTDFIPSFPPLENPRKMPRIRQALDMMKSNGHTGNSVCLTHQEDPQVVLLDYLDRYRRSRQAIKHQIVLTSDGKVEAFDQENAPGDLHDIIGQRLPAELYFYFSRGVVGPRILNQLTSGQTSEPCPIDGGDSDEYQQLILDKLSSHREMALALLSHSLARAYQHRKVELSCWFDPKKKNVIDIAELPASRETIRQWNVPNEVIDSSPSLKEGISLTSAVQALTDKSFASKSRTARDASGSKVLETVREVTANSLWRFLHLRGYIDSSHNLTSWGQVLAAMLSKADPSDQFEEPIFLALELLRLRYLSSEDIFPKYDDAPSRGSETDKANALLLSRLSCLTHLRHKPIGFTGPLTRNLLAYSSVINAVRRNNRDLLEISVLTLLLNGDASHDFRGSSLPDTSQNQPNGIDNPSTEQPVYSYGPAEVSLQKLTMLSLPSDCALGIAMKHYLDELNGHDEPTSAKTKEDIREKGPAEWFPHAIGFFEDIERGFRLWDAVMAGVRTGIEKGVVEKGGEGDETSWESVDKWVQDRR